MNVSRSGLNLTSDSSKVNGIGIPIEVSSIKKEKKEETMNALKRNEREAMSQRHPVHVVIRRKTRVLLVHACIFV